MATSTGKEKNTLSRRKLLGDMGKLAYVAPTLTVLSLVGKNAHAQIGTPPCPPEQPDCEVEPESRSSKRRPRPQGDRERSGG